MRCPNYIKKAIMIRANHAADFMIKDADIVAWMEKAGIDVCDPQFSDHILTGAESLCNPYESAYVLIQLIEEYEPLKEG